MESWSAQPSDASSGLQSEDGWYPYREAMLNLMPPRKSHGLFFFKVAINWGWLHLGSRIIPHHRMKMRHATNEFHDGVRPQLPTSPNHPDMFSNFCVETFRLDPWIGASERPSPWEVSSAAGMDSALCTALLEFFQESGAAGAGRVPRPGWLLHGRSGCMLQI